MRKTPYDRRPVNSRRLSLEQKIRLLVRRYRATAKRRRQKEAAFSKRLSLITLVARGFKLDRGSDLPYP